FCFHRASMSEAGQNIVLPVASFGTGAAAAALPCRAPWALSVRPAITIAADAASSLLRIIGPLSMALRQAAPDVEGRPCQPDSTGWRTALLLRSLRGCSPTRRIRSGGYVKGVRAAALSDTLRSKDSLGETSWNCAPRPRELSISSRPPSNA